MPGFLLHVGATVMCAHGGQATPTVPNPRVTVMGQPTVTLTAPYVVAGCTFPPNTCQGGVGGGASALNITIPMPALRQQ